jgi:hypothetical protein
MCARHLGGRTCRAAADDARPLTGHTEASAIDAPVRLREIQFVKERICDNFEVGIQKLPISRSVLGA